MRGLNERVPHEPHGVVAMVITKDEDDIGSTAPMEWMMFAKTSNPKIRLLTLNSKQLKR